MSPTNSAKATQPPPSLTFQGIVVPGSSLNPKAFFAGTRRQTVLQRTIGSGSWAGFGNTDVVDTLRSGILSGYFVKVSGSLVITLGGGTVSSTAAWPYGYLRAVRFQANGQSNLCNADGWFLRARELLTSTGLTDRGVIAGLASGNQGSMALASESWGVGSSKSDIAAGTYDVELTFYVPVAYEKKMLTGAVFCQTLSTTLELDLDYANLSDLFVTTGAATVVFTPTTVIEAEMFTIPSDGKGGMYLPNLSAFHSYIQVKAPNSISSGNNEITLSGQGVGRQLMRVLWRTLCAGSGVGPATTPAPFSPYYFDPDFDTPLNQGDMAKLVTSPYWRYGTNTTPETWVDGQDLRYQNERDYGTDLDVVNGFEVIDFDRTWAFRDSVDEGSATELRFGYSPTDLLGTSPSVQYAQDVILAGAAA